MAPIFSAPSIPRAPTAGPFCPPHPSLHPNSTLYPLEPPPFIPPSTQRYIPRAPCTDTCPFSIPSHVAVILVRMKYKDLGSGALGKGGPSSCLLGFLWDPGTRECSRRSSSEGSGHIPATPPILPPPSPVSHGYLRLTVSAAFVFGLVTVNGGVFIFPLPSNPVGPLLRDISLGCGAGAPPLVGRFGVRGHLEDPAAQGGVSDSWAMLSLSSLPSPGSFTVQQVSVSHCVLSIFSCSPM